MNKRTAITLAVMILILAVLLICSAIASLRIPAIVVILLMITLIELKWEPDSWVATGSRRPLRVLCQIILILIPAAIAGALIYIQIS
jgi:hypothetical protein